MAERTVVVCKTRVRFPPCAFILSKITLKKGIKYTERVRLLQNVSFEAIKNFYSFWGPENLFDFLEVPKNPQRIVVDPPCAFILSKITLKKGIECTERVRLLQNVSKINQKRGKI